MEVSVTKRIRVFDAAAKSSSARTDRATACWDRSASVWVTRVTDAGWNGVSKDPRPSVTTVAEATEGTRTMDSAAVTRATDPRRVESRRHHHDATSKTSAATAVVITAGTSQGRAPVPVGIR